MFGAKQHSSAGFGEHRHVMVKKPLSLEVLASPSLEIQETLYYEGAASPALAFLSLLFLSLSALSLSLFLLCVCWPY